MVWLASARRNQNQENQNFMTTKQAFVTEKLNEFWQAEVAPNVKKNCCILSARITSEVFNYFNIQNKVIPVSAFVCNEEMAESISTSVPRDNWSKTAWSVGVGPNWVGEIKSTTGDFNAHLVTVTRTHFVDLSSSQFDRHAYNIDTGQSIIRKLTEFNKNFLAVSELKDFLHTPIDEGHFFWHPIKDNSYKHANDWLFNYARDIGKAITYIKTAIRSA